MRLDAIRFPPVRQAAGRAGTSGFPLDFFSHIRHTVAASAFFAAFLAPQPPDQECGRECCFFFAKPQAQVCNAEPFKRKMFRRTGLTTVRPLTCPHCGGREFSFPSKGRCRCLSCKSEFLLDDPSRPSPARPSGASAATRRLTALCFLLLLIAAAAYLLTPARPSQPSPQPARQRPAAASVVRYELQQLALTADTARGGAPLVLRVRGSLGRKGPAGYVADIYDPRTQTWSETPQPARRRVREARRRQSIFFMMGLLSRTVSVLYDANGDGIVPCMPCVGEISAGYPERASHSGADLGKSPAVIKNLQFPTFQNR